MNKNIIKKRLVRQDTELAINPGNNNETSIKISPEMCSLFFETLPTNDEFREDIRFWIHKEDFKRSAYEIIRSLPLLDHKGKQIIFSNDYCDNLLSKINDFFGDDEVKAYNAELKKNLGHGFCMQGFDKDFNIRHYTVENRSVIGFEKKEDGVHMRLEYSKSDDAVDNWVEINLPIQQIYYGAPGTGKSYTINSITENLPNDSVFRTTFHPDSDYSTFVGAYKPTTIEVPKQFTFGDKLKTFTDNEGKAITEQKVIYSFVKQSFLKAYLKSWEDITKIVVLVVEEINRGNCAQIFGDLFQLLDRKNGFSCYPICADEDLHKLLKMEFSRLSKPSNEKIELINSIYSKHYTDIISKVWNGEVLLLPNNFLIWATMNTSDQSLFPIDSAFKRRWDWKYVKIINANLGWKLIFNNEKIIDEFGNEIGYSQDWWQFLEKINAVICSITDSADKQLGYFFCIADSDGCIDADTFVNKVVLYLWNDVFKDYGFEDIRLFGYSENKNGIKKVLAFPDFFMDNGTVNEHIAASFVKNIISWGVSDLQEE